MLIDAEDLTQQAENDALVEFQQGRKNHMADMCCTYILIGSSVLASVAVAAKWETWFVALAAALPGAVAAIQRAIDFRGRARWYFRKWARLTNVSRKLSVCSITLEDAAEQIGEIEMTMEDRWGEIGKPVSPTAVDTTADTK
jgi:hypothetical protein